MAITLNGTTGITTPALDSQGVAVVNRQTTDGTIIDLRKDGTTVGSIGTTTDNLDLDSGSTGRVNIDSVIRVIGTKHSANPRVDPVTDAAVNLGGSTNRWKDLLLSGGVYLGGTGAANYLDDYEEGTWNPVDNNANAYSSSVPATYTKIGRIVYINFDVSSTGSTGGHGIYGLPFTASPSSVTGNWSVYGGYSTSNADLWGHINSNINHITMYVGSSAHVLAGRWIGAGFYYSG